MKIFTFLFTYTQKKNQRKDQISFLCLINILTNVGKSTTVKNMSSIVIKERCVSVCLGKSTVLRSLTIRMRIVQGRSKCMHLRPGFCIF